MRAGPQASLLSDNRRLHLQHGPIDLIIEAQAEPAAVQAAYGAAIQRFDGLLETLCEELPLLRAPQAVDSVPAQGVVARRMQAAVAPHAGSHFITPMAAVAGAVADEILAAMCAAAPLRRAFVNNGGDIALYLAEGEDFAIGLVDRPDRPGLFARSHITAGEGIGGIATSGWRGRSFSLGIADAVTVLAVDAAAADAAATIIANAVDIPGHPGILRVPASSLQPDSDLGERPVTRAVGPLSDGDIATALRAGEAKARNLIDSGLIRAGALHLAGVTALVSTANTLLQPKAA
ncbi:thiamine biosynthesis protein ApbE [Labrys sp. WJW]|uniref:UPF0280 family protein n=1 Tax=Labrys sp. WJW TaxID=1737983 RepID=UPI00083119CE|nr:UPF0280 family protein [Labrys sp. WJW]OCC00408.1 thiamine biosynthesis protein ApbE [Labrys sp. WJW]